MNGCSIRARKTILNNVSSYYSFVLSTPQQAVLPNGDHKPNKVSAVLMTEMKTGLI